MRAGFLALAGGRAPRFAVIDATAPFEAVFDTIMATVADRLPELAAVRGRPREAADDEPSTLSRAHISMTDTGTPPAGRPSTEADEADQAVLDQVADGRLEALEELYDRYRTMAYSIALRITSDAGAAEDVVQDAFLGAWRNAARYERGPRQREDLAPVDRPPPRRGCGPPAPPHHRAARPRGRAAGRPDPARPLAGGLRGPRPRGRALALSSQLSDVQREAIELAYFGGLTQQEIAARTSTPLGTVKSRMRLGLLAMRRSLLGDGAVSGMARSRLVRRGGGRAMSCDDVREQAAAFVLGALTPAEEREVRDHLATCPEAHAEFAELGGVVPALAESVEQVEPPPALRDRIMAAAAADLAARGAGARPERRARAGPRAARACRDRRHRSDRSAARRAPRFGWALGIAAALAIAALGAWNVGLRSQLSDAQAYQQRVDQVLAIARTPGAVFAVLAPATAGGQDGLIAIDLDRPGGDGRQGPAGHRRERGLRGLGHRRHERADARSARSASPARSRS